MNEIERKQLADILYKVDKSDLAIFKIKLAVNDMELIHSYVKLTMYMVAGILGLSIGMAYTLLGIL